MEPVIRNYRSVYQPGGAAVKLISLDDHPTTCTLTYSVIEPGTSSAHHLHPWEHEVYILEGSGVLVCDGQEYPVREGDGLFIPGNVDHYTRNTQPSGVIRRLEVNPLLASQRSDARQQGAQGTGQPPVIRNYRDLDMHVGHVLLKGTDGVPTAVMLYNGAMVPGAISHADTGGHIHRWEHLVYVVQGAGTLVCEGKPYPVTEGDGVLVPPQVRHQWRNETQEPMLRVTFNAVLSEAHEG